MGWSSTMMNGGLVVCLAISYVVFCNVQSVFCFFVNLMMKSMVFSLK